MKNYKNVTEFLPCKNTTSVAQVLFVKLVSYFLPDLISSCEVNGGITGQPYSYVLNNVLSLIIVYKLTRFDSFNALFVFNVYMGRNVNI